MYRVGWEIDIEADCPAQAASRARIIQRDNDPANTATVFSVRQHGPNPDAPELLMPGVIEIDLSA